MKDDLAVIVAEHHMVKPHIAPEGDQRTVRLFPSPRASIEGCLAQRPVPALRHPYQRYGAVVDFRGLLQNLKDALRAGHSGEDGIHLLGNLRDRLAHLLCVIQKRCETA